MSMAVLLSYNEATSNTAAFCFFLIHYSDVTMDNMATQITGVSTGCPSICSGVNKKNIKAPRHQSLWGEAAGDRWIPFTKGQ